MENFNHKVYALKTMDLNIVIINATFTIFLETIEKIKISCIHTFYVDLYQCIMMFCF